MINFIYASDDKGLIGVGDELPWHDQEELQHFKRVTKGHLVVMGYKTYESIGKNPLPHRRNFVLVRDKDNLPFTEIDDLIKAVTLDEIISVQEKHPYLKVFVLGGANTFKLFEPYVNGKIYHSLLTDESIKNPDLLDAPDKIYYQPSDALKQRMRLSSIKKIKHFIINTYDVVA